MQSCTQGAFVSFLLSFGFRVGRLAVGGDVFFFKLYLLWSVYFGHWTKDFQCKFYWGRPGGLGGEDLFSFQPIGGPKVPCFYSF